ncbi:transcriptional regulator [Candidatus Aerophobetes bacterium Ae_b3a]|nr:MAG: transcriptional regulator [Candidatus Aerophobetes bacterium Ae_b3a]
MLKKIECFFQPSKLDEIKDELVKMDVGGMSVSEVKGFGTQRGYLEGEKINKKVKFLPKIKVEIVVDEEIVEQVIETIRRLCTAKTIGAGKIFVIPVEDAVRIRTAEVGKSAIY